MGLVFEWDETKAGSNAGKHGVTFGEAASIFGDPLTETKADTRVLEHDERMFCVGESECRRLLAVSHTEVGDVIRIISARPATAKERRDYGQSR
jgi:uncharacterized DUF497 family protein